MGLKITTPIGTDQGITNEAYVRISNYAISKQGNAQFNLQLFLSKEVSTVNGNMMGLHINTRNAQIGEVLNVQLTKEVTGTRIVSKPTYKEVEIIDVVSSTDENGVVTEETMIRKEMRMVQEDVEEVFTTTVPDLSPLENANLFEFAYSKLSDKLKGLFGVENILNN